MSTNGNVPREINLIRATGMEYNKGVWADEYPAEYNRDAVMREVDERIREYIFNPAGDGAFLDNSIPRSKIRDNLAPVIVHSVIQHAGALPQSGTLEKVYDDSHCWFHHTGSAYTSTTAGILEVALQVDGLSWGFQQLFANALNTHMFLNPWPLVFDGRGEGFPPVLHKGPHKCEFIIGGGGRTVTDGNDVFCLTVFEFPR